MWLWCEQMFSVALLCVAWLCFFVGNPSGLSSMVVWQVCYLKPIDRRCAASSKCVWMRVEITLFFPPFPSSVPVLSFLPPLISFPRHSSSSPSVTWFSFAFFCLLPLHLHSPCLLCFPFLCFPLSSNPLSSSAQCVQTGMHFTASSDLFCLGKWVWLTACCSLSASSVHIAHNTGAGCSL